MFANNFKELLAKFSADAGDFHAILESMRC